MKPTKKKSFAGAVAKCATMITKAQRDQLAKGELNTLVVRLGAYGWVPPTKRFMEALHEIVLLERRWLRNYERLPQMRVDPKAEAAVEEALKLLYRTGYVLSASWAAEEDQELATAKRLKKALKRNPPINWPDIKAICPNIKVLDPHDEGHLTRIPGAPPRHL